MKFDIISLTVEDMERAVNFYKKVFKVEPEKENNRFSYFQLENARLGLYNPDADGVDVPFGENCVPAFKTNDIDTEHERLDGMAPEIEEITDNGSYRIFHFKDPEGNMVEVYEGEK
nr:MAG: lactoylglutathione lyase-like protein [Candidatus Nanosalinarum sp. J07AB56]